MDWSTIVSAATSAAISILVTRWIMARGKVSLRHALLQVGVASAVAACLVLLAMRTGTSFGPACLGVVLAIPTTHVLAGLVRGRDRTARAWLSIVCAGSYMLSFLVKEPAASCFLLAGTGCGLALAVYVWHAPYLNASWLDAVIHETAVGCPHGARYSPRPVTVSIPVGRHFATECHGVALFARSDRIVIRISRRAHMALGCPDLAEFSAKLAHAVVSWQDAPRHSVMP